MYFGLSDDQTLLQDSVRGTLERTTPLEIVRQYVQGDDTAYAKTEAALNELGLPLTLVPESEGGLGLNVLEAALISEMLGRYVAPSAFIAHSMAVAGFAMANAHGHYENNFAVAVHHTIDARENCDITLANNTATGETHFLLGADNATHYLVATNKELAIIEKDAKGAKETSLTTIDKTRKVSALKLQDTPAIIIDASDAATHMINVGRVLLAADSLGAANMMIEKSVAYAQERQQFNRPIGSFQAVKHMCAEMAARLEPCRALVWYAAHAQNQVPEEAALMSRHALSHISEVGRFIARTATEVHGGMGFTDLLGLHYWFKRIGANAKLLGSPEILREEAARLQDW